MHSKAQSGPVGEGKGRLVLVFRASWEEKIPVGAGGFAALKKVGHLGLLTMASLSPNGTLFSL